MRFPYTLRGAVCHGRRTEEVCIGVDLACEPGLCEDQGAPRIIQLIYRLSPAGLQFDTAWFGKDANRLTEAVFLHLFPAAGGIRLRKLGEWVDPASVVSMGGRNLHAVQEMELNTAGGRFRWTNRHAPLLSIGLGKILEYDNRFEDAGCQGITYVLYNNVWGTNFPLWYEENARFHFEITTACPAEEGEK